MKRISLIRFFFLLVFLFLFLTCLFSDLKASISDSLTALLSLPSVTITKKPRSGGVGATHASVSDVGGSSKTKKKAGAKKLKKPASRAASAARKSAAGPAAAAAAPQDMAALVCIWLMHINIYSLPVLLLLLLLLLLFLLLLLRVLLLLLLLLFLLFPLRSLFFNNYKIEFRLFSSYSVSSSSLFF
jgi:hypothetical protein